LDNIPAASVAITSFDDDNNFIKFSIKPSKPFIFVAASDRFLKVIKQFCYSFEFEFVK
jgi:hypothetical protein